MNSLRLTISLSLFYGLFLVTFLESLPAAPGAPLSKSQLISVARESLYDNLIGNPTDKIPPGVITNLKAGVSVNARFDDRDRNTLLTHAAGFGQLGAIEYLLKLAASVNDTNERHQTALWQAAQSPLLGRNGGFDPSQVKERQKVFDRDLDIYIRIIRTLLHHSADVELADKNGMTPLDIAAFCGRKEIVAALLEGKADPNRRDEFGRTPVEWASYNGYPEIVELMQAHNGASGALPDPDQSHLDNDLCEACESHDILLVRKLLANGANPNTSNFRGYQFPGPDLGTREIIGVEFFTPLLRATSSPAITRILLEAGAIPDCHDSEGVTPLMKANSEVASLLLRSGANLNARDDEGVTVLMHRVDDDDENAVRELLKHNPILETKTPYGVTAVHFCRSEKVLSLLLDKHANINNRDNEGRTDLIDAADSTWGEGDAAACSENWARILVRHGADPNIADKNGNTALMLMAAQGEYGYYNQGNPILLAKYLLWRGARLDLKNKRGVTALDIANKHGAKSLARLFRNWSRQHPVH